MLRSRPRLLAALLLAALTALAGCADDSDVDSSATNSTTLTVWSSLPLQGRDAERSRDVLDGQKLALLQAGGRVGPYTVKLSSLDASTAVADGWTPEQAAENARRALRDRTTIAYLGESSAGATAVSLPILNAAGIPAVSPLTGYAGFTGADGAVKGEPDKYYPAGVRSFARVVPPDTAEAGVLAEALEERDCARVAVLEARDLEGRGMARALRDALEEAGGEVQATDAITVTEDSAADQVAREVAEADAGCAVYAGGDQPWAPALLDGVHAARPQLVLAAGSSAATPAFTAALAAGTQADLVLAAPVPAPGSPLRAFRAEFRRTYGRAASSAAAFGHASMRVVLRAIAAAGVEGGGNRREVGEALFRLPPAPTAVGRLGIRPDGDPTLERVRRLEVRDGRAVPR